MATSVRFGLSRDRGVGGRRAERAVQRVRGQIGGVQLARREPAELLGDLAHAHARGVEQRLALDQRDGRRAGRQHRAAARRVEARGGDAVAVDLHGDPDQVPAHGASGVAVMAPGQHDAAPVGRGEVFGEALAIHERRVYDRRLLAQSVRPASLNLRSRLREVTRGVDGVGLDVLGQLAGLARLDERDGAMLARGHDLQPLLLEAAVLRRRGRAGDLAAVLADERDAALIGGRQRLLAANRRMRPAVHARLVVRADLVGLAQVRRR